MDNAPRVEIVIPTFNRRHYLEEAVESVQRQTFRSWRLIIVDDGSTDGTPEYLAAFNDEKIIPVILEQKAERSQARNLGLLRCQGEFVLFLDDDDLLYPKAIEDHLRALDDCGDAVASIGGVLRFGQSIAPTKHRVVRKRRLAGIFDDLLFGCNFVCGQTMFRAADLRRVGGWDPAVTFAEDYELWLRVAAGSKVVLIPHLVLKQRVHAGQWRPDNYHQIAARMRNRAISDLNVRQRNRASRIVRAGELAEQARESFYKGRIFAALGKIFASLGSAPPVLLSPLCRRELFPRSFRRSWIGLRARLGR